MSNGGSGSHSSSPSVQAASQPQHQPPASLTLLNPFLPIRRLVSGSRSRFYDPHLSLDLDLTYLTDQLILTSFPAPSSSSPSSALKGVQGLYRNRSEDVARFLASRHERGTWRVYNLVPAGVHPSSSSSSTSSTPARQNPQAYIKGGGRKGEASYAAAPTFGAWGAGGEADGVSRYPFPDHHPPPLSLIPLMVADLTSWLQGGRSETRVRYVPGEEKFDAAATSPTCGGADPDPDVGAEGAAGHSTKPDLSKKQAQRVAVIHCKAGKGRTGTMAICYLLTQAEMPAPPRDPRNHSGYRPPLPQPAPGPNSAAGAGVSGEDGAAKDGGAQVRKTKSLGRLRSLFRRKSSGKISKGEQAQSDEAGQGGDGADLQAGTIVDHGARAVPRSRDASTTSASQSSSSEQPRHPITSSAQHLQPRAHLGLAPPYGRRASASSSTSYSAQLDEKDRQLGMLTTRNRSTSYLSDGGAHSASAGEGGAHDGRRSRSTSGSQLRSSMSDEDDNEEELLQDAPFDPVEHVSERLRAVLEMHTSRRLKPASSSSSLNSSKGKNSLDVVQGNAGTALNASPTRTGMGARKPSFSTLKTRLLGEKPGNASASTRPEDSEPPADDSQQHMSSSSSGASLAPPDRRRERTASSSSRNNGIFGVASAGRSTDDLSLSQAQRQGTSSTFVQARSAESQDIASIDGKPRYGVSIPSQRRWIGYWARVLALNDPRAVLRSHMPRERRQVTIVRISVDRIVHLKGNGVQKLSGPMAERETREEDDNAPGLDEDHLSRQAGKQAGKLQWLLPHSDSLSVHVGRYDDTVVQRLESWERTARKRNTAYGAQDPSASSHELANGSQPRLMQQRTDWGINCDAEANTARSFDFRGTHGEGTIHYFAQLQESSRRALRPSEHPPSLVEKARHSLSNKQNALVRYDFLPAEDKKLQEYTSSQSSTDGSAYFSDRSAPYAVAGLPVDADRELNLKVLLGRSGATHAILPDVAAAGWTWFIPSFEDPQGGLEPQNGARTVLRFEKDEIDFCKGAMGVVGMEVEWQWTRTADFE